MDHPLVAHKLTTLRDVRTDSPTFRRLTDELVTLLAYEATRNVRVSEATVQTPLAEAVGVQLSRPGPLVVPILRAGLGMLDGMTRLLPTAEVGFLGMVRDEETLQPVTYADRLPPGPVRTAVLCPRPHAGDGRHVSGGVAPAGGARRRPCHCAVPACCPGRAGAATHWFERGA